MPPAFFLRPLGWRLWFRRFGCVTSPGVLRARLARIHLRATRACACCQRICGLVGHSPAVRECFVSTQRTWPVPQPMWLVECVEILRFLLVSWCLRGVHVRCVDTAHQSATPVGNHCTEIPVNSSSGAKCFLTLHLRYTKRSRFGLNAPSGARCFLAPRSRVPSTPSQRLNAPSGARCFLASNVER